MPRPLLLSSSCWQPRERDVLQSCRLPSVFSSVIDLYEKISDFTTLFQSMPIWFPFVDLGVSDFPVLTYDWWFRDTFSPREKQLKATQYLHRIADLFWWKNAFERKIFDFQLTDFQLFSPIYSLLIRRTKGTIIKKRLIFEISLCFSRSKQARWQKYHKPLKSNRSTPKGNHEQRWLLCTLRHWRCWM